MDASIFTRMAGERMNDIKGEKQHTVGKRYIQKIERKHLTYRTRIKRLARKTICFSKSELMHDTVIGLFINRFEFGYSI